MMRTAKYDEQSRRLELVTDGRQAVSEPSEEIKASDLNKDLNLAPNPIIAPLRNNVNDAMERYLA